MLAARRSFIGGEWVFAVLMLIAAFLDSFGPLSLGLVAIVPLAMLVISLAANHHLSRWRDVGSGDVPSSLARLAIVHSGGFLFLLSLAFAWLFVITASGATDLNLTTAVMLELSLFGGCLVLTSVYAPRLLAAILPGQPGRASPSARGLATFLAIPLLVAGIPLGTSLSLLTTKEPAMAIAGLTVVGVLPIYGAVLAFAYLYLIVILNRT